MNIISFFTVLSTLFVWGNGFSHQVTPLKRINRHNAYMLTNEVKTSDIAQIPIKVAICGGGVGGMFLTYALQKKGFDVSVFEKSKQFSRFGGPIQLASNALSCVKAVDPNLFDMLMTRFTFTGTRKVTICIN